MRLIRGRVGTVTTRPLVGIALDTSVGGGGMSSRPRMPALSTPLVRNTINNLGLSLTILGRNTMPMTVSFTQRFLTLGFWARRCVPGTRPFLGTVVRPMAFFSTIVSLPRCETLLDQCHKLNLGKIKCRWHGSGVGHVLGQRPATS